MPIYSIKINLIIILFASFASANVRCVSLFDKPINQIVKSKDGKTSFDYFKHHHDPTTGLLRYVMVMGVPGSGKSTWTNYAKKMGWVVVENDQIRVDFLKHMKANRLLIPVYRDINTGKEIEYDLEVKNPNASITWEVPEPFNTEHIFSKVPFVYPTNGPLDYYRGKTISLYEFSFIEAKRIINKAFRDKKPIVLDGVNSHLGRIKDIHHARKMKRYIEGLYFESSDVNTNINNVMVRVLNGGFDIPSYVIKKLFKELQNTNNSLVIDKSYTQAKAQVLPDIDLNTASTQIKQVQSVSELRSYFNDKKIEPNIKIFLNEHVLNKLTIIPVKDFSK